MALCIQKYPDKNSTVSGIVVIHQPSHRILLLLKENGSWDLPKGHVQPGENFLSAAERECEEETGLVSGYNLDVFPNNYISIASHSFLRFYLGFTNDKHAVRISSEHIDYYWATPEEALELFDDNNHFSQIIKAMCILSYC